MFLRSRRTTAETGVTVIELTIALSVFLIVITAMYTLFAVVQRTTVRQDSRNQVVNEIGLALERLTKDARQATKIYGDSSASVLHIDTYDNGTAITVTFAASGTTLTRTVGAGSAQTLLDGLTSTSLFTYSPSVGTATDITITVNAKPTHYANDAAVVSLTSQVRLRNRGSS